MLGTALTGLLLAATPAPDEKTPPAVLVTPGTIGFTVTLLVALAVIALMLDMNRRIRRQRYRQEIAEKLDAEERAAAEAPDDDRPTS